MAGEKAKENRTLQASCAGCGKDLSVELLRGVTVGAGRDRRIVAVCRPCLDKGWDAKAPAPPPAVAVEDPAAG
jgi:hypothetical protein